MINSKFRTRTVSQVGRRESDRGSWQCGQLFSVQAGWWTWVLTVVLSPILPSVKSGDRRITVSQVAVVIMLYYFRNTLTGMRTHHPAGSFLVLNRNAKLAPHLLSFPPFFWTTCAACGISVLWPGTSLIMYGCESWTIKKAELIFLNCGVGEDSWESLGLQGDPTSPS